jgi:hypothetical protein
MQTINLVLVDDLCKYFEVEFTFLNALKEHGLIEIIFLDNKKYISHDYLKDVERAIQFHYELNINLEGIDVINNLLNQIEDLNEELRITKNKLNLLDID